MKLLENKKALIFGVANDYSIATGIAEAFKAQGAQIALSYLNENMKKRVEAIAASTQADFIFELDVTKEDQFPAMFETVKKYWGNFDILVHSLAYTDKKNLTQPFYLTTKDSFLETINISAFSLVSLTQTLLPLMNPEASIMSMTYYGAEKVIPNYNVMGVAKACLESTTRYLAADLGEQKIRVNAISAGPIRTLASSALGGFKTILQVADKVAPLRRNIETSDVGNLSLFLASDLSKNVTGQVLYVDAGLSTIGFNLV